MQKHSCNIHISALKAFPAAHAVQLALPTARAISPSGHKGPSATIDKICPERQQQEPRLANDTTHNQNDTSTMWSKRPRQAAGRGGKKI
jgi:hypothetical protein